MGLKIESCWNGLNCQIGGLTLANKSLNDISQQIITKLQDFMRQEMQEVALNVALPNLLTSLLIEVLHYSHVLICIHASSFSQNV